MFQKLIQFYLKIFLIWTVVILLAWCQRTPLYNKKEPCMDYPSCKLISPQAFEQYCSRSTLKNMCPTQCDKKCKSLKSAVSSEESKLIEEQIREELKEKISALQALSTTAMTTNQPSLAPSIDFNKTATASRQTTSFTMSKQEFTSTSSSPTVIRPSSQSAPSSSSGPKVITGNTTIFVPLLEAGFIQRVVVSSSRKGHDYSRASVCRQISSCQRKSVWMPASNEAPREQLEILFNYTTDIYKFEIQGSVFGNETVTSFLFQYLNETNNGTLVNYFYRTQSKSSSKINRFLFRPPVRTKYIRLIPIDYEKAIAMRFEVYSRGTLYAPNEKSVPNKARYIH